MTQKKQTAKPSGAPAAVAEPDTPAILADANPVAPAPGAASLAGVSTEEYARTKELEREATAGDLIFDDRMTAPTPVVQAASTPGQSVDDPDFAEKLATKMAEKIALTVPNPRDTMLMVGEIVKSVVLALREPTPEQKAAEEQRKRNRAVAIKEQAESIQAVKDAQDMCPHEEATSDGKTHTTIAAVHNFADGRLRGLCMACRKLIEYGDPAFGIVIAQHNQAVRSMHAGAH